jgi:hypothetical protein
MTQGPRARPQLGGLTMLADSTAEPRWCGRSATWLEPSSTPVSLIFRRCMDTYISPFSESDRSGDVNHLGMLPLSLTRLPKVLNKS